MKRKIDIKNIIIFLLIISQIYLFYKLNSMNQFDSIITNNIEIRDINDSTALSISDAGLINIYNMKGDKVLQIGPVGYQNGGGLKLYDKDGNIATFIDNRIINTYSNDSTYSTSLGRDMKNQGFIALFDSTGKTYFVKKK